MEDTSFFSGLSSIGEAVGEAGYGRCVSVLVTSCTPAADELAVRLGGPGCPWEVLPLPMQQPVVLHRQPGVGIARRATELAFATTAYATDTAGNADDVHPSTELVAMDVLTGTAVAAAAVASVTDGTVAALTAVAGNAGDDDDSNSNGDAAPPLHVSFRWAVGEFLPGATPPTAAEVAPHPDEEAPEMLLPTSDGDDDRDNALHTPRTPTPIGDEATTPLSSEEQPPTPPTLQPAPPDVAAEAGESEAVQRTSVQDTEEHETVPSEVAPIAAHSDTDAPSQPKSPSAADPLRAPDSDAESDGKGAPAHASEDGAPPNTMPSGAQSSSSRSNTPRRQRPRNYRRSTIHMEMAPELTPPPTDDLAAAPEERDTASEDTVQISDDDDDDVAVVMHRPPPPPPPPRPPQSPAAAAAVAAVAVIAADEAEGEAAASTTGRQLPPSHAAPALDPHMVEPAHTTSEVGRSSGSAGDRTPSSHVAQLRYDADATPEKQRSPQQQQQRTAKAAPPPPLPTADTLFEGADGAAVVVIVGVVSLCNSNGAADPHRVVRVDLEAAERHSGSHAGVLAFRTAPALRGLAMAVPQVSSVVLLPSTQHRHSSVSQTDSEAVADAATLPPLHVTCVVTEQVEAATDGSASTTLWSAVADVAPPRGSPSAAPISHQVSFTGDNGDVVLTSWTYMTVSTYRDAVLNLRSRGAAPGAHPILQMMLVDESPPPSQARTKPSRRAGGATASIWVASPAPSSSCEAAGSGALAHRIVTVSRVDGFAHQPVSVPVRDPLVYVAVQHLGSSAAPSTTASHAQPIFPRMFADAWTRLSPTTTPSSSPASSSTVLYYRIVDSSAAAAASGPASLPASLRDATTQPRQAGSDSAMLREVTVTVRPSTALLYALPSPVAASSSDAGPHTPPACRVLLRHAATRAVLAESSAATGVLTYRGFLPLPGDTRRAPMRRAEPAAASAASHADADADGMANSLFRDPWEVLLIADAAPPAKPRTAAARPAARLPDRGATAWRGDVAAGEVAAAWTGSMQLSCAALYSAPPTGTHWRTRVCVSALPPSSARPSLPAATAAALRSPSAALGARLEVTCAVRCHPLGTDSAVFCLRSLRLVPSPVSPVPPSGGAPSPPSQAQLWFTTGGSSAEGVRSAWADAGSAPPTVKDVQRAWAPASSASCCSCTPLLCIDDDGRLVPSGTPVLLSTTNACARLCVALTAAAASLDDARSLRRRVAAVRKGAIHRFKKARGDGEDSGTGEGRQRRRRPAPTAQQMPEVFVQCVDAVAMRVDNYVEVDLSASLAAASERLGQTRHRLLLSSVSGAVRVSRHAVLELQGQWIKMPRHVQIIPPEYTPSPRLWALRCSSMVRQPDTPPRAARCGSGATDGVELAQEVLEAHMGYDVVVRSVPLDYTDPTEHAVQTVLPGLSFDKLVLKMKLEDERVQPYCEVVSSASSSSTTAAAMSARRGARSATTANGDAAAEEDMAELLEFVFGPTGIAHTAYASEASHKVAVVHFVFGDAYTTRTALSVSCTPSAAAVSGVAAPSHTNGHAAPPSSSLREKSSAALSSSSSVQVVCDGLVRTATLYGFLPESVVARRFPGVSHRRYPPELSWYHGDLTVPGEEERQRREDGEAAWRRGLTEQRLGELQTPGSLVASAVTQHPYDCLPLMVEPSLTRCSDGRHYIVFGGLSTATGAASSCVYAFDAAAQMWQLLRAQRGSRGGLVSSSSPVAVPSPRYGHTAVYRPADGAVYVFGGRGPRDSTATGPMSGAYDKDDVAGGSAAAVVYGDVWRLSWDANAGTVVTTELHCTWADAPSSAVGVSQSHVSLSLVAGDLESGLARWRHAAVLHDDYMVVFGGQSSAGACCSCAELLYLDMKTQEWAARRSFGADVPCPRYGHVATVAKGGAILFVFGGWTMPSSLRDSDTLGDTVNSDGRQTATALSDLFKMDLITRMWSRVVPNGAVRPPALEMADMTSCTLDGCPVILLVGGRVPDAAAAGAAATTDAGAAPLEVFLFSTATLFWRVVAMDCTPVAARFGLRAAASATFTHASGSGHGTDATSRPDLSRVRRALPTRGLRIGEILVVGGLPLTVANVAQTAPAISILLSVGGGSNAAGRRAITAAHATAAPESQEQSLTPRPPTAPRGVATRRPMTSPALSAPRRPHPPPGSRASGESWSEQDGSSAAAAGTRRSAERRRHRYRRPPSAAAGRGAVDVGWASLDPHHLSCYSTLTPRQQRRLVRRLYTQDIETRVQHRHQLQGEVDLERATPPLRFGRRRSRSPGTGRSPSSARQASAPLHRPAFDAAAAASGLAAPSVLQRPLATEAPVNGAPLDASAAQRELHSAFLRRSGSSTGSSSLTSSTTRSSTSRSIDGFSSVSRSSGARHASSPRPSAEAEAAPSALSSSASSSSFHDAESDAEPMAPRAAAAAAASAVSPSSRSSAASDDEGAAGESRGAAEGQKDADSPSDDDFESASSDASSAAAAVAVAVPPTPTPPPPPPRAASVLVPVAAVPVPVPAPVPTVETTSEGEHDGGSVAAASSIASSSSSTPAARPSPPPPPPPPALSSSSPPSSSRSSSSASSAPAPPVDADEAPERDAPTPLIPTPPASTSSPSLAAAEVSSRPATPPAAEVPSEAQSVADGASSSVAAPAAPSTATSPLSSARSARPASGDDVVDAGVEGAEKAGVTAAAPSAPAHEQDDGDRGAATGVVSSNDDDDDDDWEVDSEAEDAPANDAPASAIASSPQSSSGHDVAADKDNSGDDAEVPEDWEVAEDPAPEPRVASASESAKEDEEEEEEEGEGVVPVADAHDEVATQSPPSTPPRRDGSGSAVSEASAAASSAPRSSQQSVPAMEEEADAGADDAVPREDEEDYAAVDDDWETMSDAHHDSDGDDGGERAGDDGDVGGALSVSEEKPVMQEEGSRSSVSAAAADSLEDLTPPPAPREHATPPSSSLSSPPAEEAAAPSVSEATEHELSSDTGVEEEEPEAAAPAAVTAGSSPSLPPSSIAGSEAPRPTIPETPLGILSDEADSATSADDGEDGEDGDDDAAADGSRDVPPSAVVSVPDAAEDSEALTSPSLVAAEVEDAAVETGREVESRVSSSAAGPADNWVDPPASTPHESEDTGVEEEEEATKVESSAEESTGALPLTSADAVATDAPAAPVEVVSREESTAPASDEMPGDASAASIPLPPPPMHVGDASESSSDGSSAGGVFVGAVDETGENVEEASTTDDDGQAMRLPAADASTGSAAFGTEEMSPRPSIGAAAPTAEADDSASEAAAAMGDRERGGLGDADNGAAAVAEREPSGRETETSHPSVGDGEEKRNTESGAAPSVPAAEDDAEVVSHRSEEDAAEEPHAQSAPSPESSAADVPSEPKDESAAVEELSADDDAVEEPHDSSVHVPAADAPSEPKDESAANTELSAEDAAEEPEEEEEEEAAPVAERVADDGAAESQAASSPSPESSASDAPSEPRDESAAAAAAVELSSEDGAPSGLQDESAARSADDDAAEEPHDSSVHVPTADAPSEPKDESAANTELSAEDAAEEPEEEEEEEEAAPVAERVADDGAAESQAASSPSPESSAADAPSEPRDESAAAAAAAEPSAEDAAEEPEAAASAAAVELSSEDDAPSEPKDDSAAVEDLSADDDAAEEPHDSSVHVPTADAPSEAKDDLAPSADVSRDAAGEAEEPHDASAEAAELSSHAASASPSEPSANPSPTEPQDDLPVAADVSAADAAEEPHDESAALAAELSSADVPSEPLHDAAAAEADSSFADDAAQEPSAADAPSGLQDDSASSAEPSADGGAPPVACDNAGVTAELSAEAAQVGPHDESAPSAASSEEDDAAGQPQDELDLPGELSVDDAPEELPGEAAASTESGHAYPAPVILPPDRWDEVSRETPPARAHRPLAPAPAASAEASRYDNDDDDDDDASQLGDADAALELPADETEEDEETPAPVILPPDRWDKVSRETPPARAHRPLAPAPAASAEASRYDNDNDDDDADAALELPADEAAEEETPVTHVIVPLPSPPGGVSGELEASVQEADGSVVELDDGRDLLDRRRGVEVAVQDDDFDF
ncbi:Galactose oxidase, central domain containing protein [Novymonas esmeraldas]|uniref:Galactose oxidase, central domain containing protein n=1 Tax=Novymonas esmeraldas TaxID=1808958 RepID=A0AAW0ET54_9TRYP